MKSIGYRRKRNIKIIIGYSTLIIVTILALLPIIWIFLMSIRNEMEVLNIPPKIIPDQITFEAYKIVLSKSSNIHAFINSIVVCSVVTILSIIIASFTSYGLSRFRFRGGNVFNIFLLVTQMLPAIFLLLSYFLIIKFIGMYNTYFGLILAYLSFTLPFCIIMLKNYFDSTPREIDEAALLDGCSRLKVLLKIIIPINIPSIIATGAYAFIVAWSELLFAITLTSSKNMRLLTVAISVLIGEQDFKWNQMMALSFLSFIPLAIAWIFVQKYVIEGMTAGAIKS